MMKSSRSMSVRSLRVGKDPFRASFYENNIDFEKELNDACCKFECFGIEVRKGLQNDDFYKAIKAEMQRKTINKRMSIAATMHVPPTPPPPTIDDGKPATDDVSDASMTTQAMAAEPPLVVVDTLYDSQDELTELLIKKSLIIPRVLMQCIGLLCPFFRYLTKFSIVKSRINGYTIYELNKILAMSSLTDICLDGSYLPEASYADLLNERSKMRHLSLSKCRITDEVCGEIAAKLHYPAPASGSLMLLNLSSNHITDAGAKKLAQALRTNRCLRYLNLADNRITDEGTGPLLDVLMEFPLTDDEIRGKRARYMKYLKEKRALLMRYFDDGDLTIPDDSRKGQPRKKTIAAGTGTSPSQRKSKKDCLTADPDMATKAEQMSLEILGPFTDPFSADCIKEQEGVVYCLGNVVLCYLNLAYNCLSYVSVKKLRSVAAHQANVKKTNEHGLLKVVLDGNPLPVICEEYDMIGQMLVNSVFRHMGPDLRRRGSVASKLKYNK